MARPTKEGLDYFGLDCQLDDKIKLIQAEFGLKGFAVVVKLFQKIYGTLGYYCEWNEDVLLLFMSENGLSSDNKNLIEDVISACIRRNIFSEKLYTTYQILTSSGIQKRYVNAVSKRVKVSMKKEYLLINVPKTMISADETHVSDVRNSINTVRNAQSKVKKSRVEKSRVEKSRVEKSRVENIECIRTPTSKLSIKSLINETDFSEELKSVIKDWASYKTEKRQGYKEVGFRKLLTEIGNRVNRHGEQAVIDVINLSMSNNWQGIIWDRIKEVEKATNSDAGYGDLSRFNS